MQFNDWTTLYHHYRTILKKQRPDRLNRFEKFYDYEITEARQNGMPVEVAFLEDEKMFFSNKRPYYNVYPGIIEPLTRVRLNAVPAKWICPPLSALLVRLPTTDNPISFEHAGMVYPLLGLLAVSKSSVVRGEMMIDIWLDIGETGAFDRPVYTLRSFRCTDGLSVEDSIARGIPHPSKRVGVPVPLEFQRTAVKLFCSLCMLDDDDSVIEPDVLREDELKYRQTKDKKYVDRAFRRRGTIGWNVGKSIEKTPHWRRAHFAICWMGRGRTTPKLRPRKGAFVKRTVVGQIPTGFLDG
jgi:hypothetical protein